MLPLKVQNAEPGTATEILESHAAANSETVPPPEFPVIAIFFGSTGKFFNAQSIIFCLHFIRASMDEIKANPSVQFKKNQQIALDISDMLEILKTEVKD